MEKESRYFIALVPPEPYYSEVNHLKQYCLEKFETSGALKSPPHITLHMPFRLKPEKVEKLISCLGAFTEHFAPLQIEQQNFGAFEPRVVFINVTKTQELQDLQNNLLKTTRREIGLDAQDYKGYGFHPHMTIAFRDLKKPKFHAAWPEFSKREISMKWLANNLALLKHDGKTWEIDQLFPLRK